MELKQDSRQLAIKTALGPDVLAVLPISVQAQLSRVFQTEAELIGQRCSDLARGARMVDALITNIMLPEIGREFLARLAAWNEIKRVYVTAKDGNFAFQFD
jgi:hypothetical protein